LASLQLSLLINPASRERRLGTTKTTAGLIIMKRRGHTRLLFFPFLSLLRLPFTNSSAREEEEDGCIDKMLLNGWEYVTYGVIKSAITRTDGRLVGIGVFLTRN